MSSTPDARVRFAPRVAVPLYKAPTFQEDSSASPVSTPRSGGAPLVPCVAHSTYTRHEHCGCVPSPKHKSSPRGSRTPPGSIARADDPDPRPPVISPPDNSAKDGEEKVSIERVPPEVPIVACVPQIEFQPPQCIGTVPVSAKCVAFSSADPSWKVLTSEKGGNLQERLALSGVATDAPRVRAPKAIVSVLKNIRGSVWSGFGDGSLRIVRDSTLVFELTRHKGAVTEIVEGADGFVYTSSLDGGILRWEAQDRESRNPRYVVTAFASHNNYSAVRCMAPFQSKLGVFLISAGDDSLIHCWPLLLPIAESQGRGFGLCGHKKAVHCLAQIDNALWSGGEDATVKVWSVESRAELCSLAGHTSAVTVIQRIGPFVWTLGRNGTCVVFDGRCSPPMTVFHTVFGDGTLGKGRQAAQLFPIAPVEGHVIWVTDTGGSTQSYYVPAPLEKSAVARPIVERTPTDTRDFEETEKAAQRYTQWATSLEAVSRSLDTTVDEGFSRLRAHFDECILSTTGTQQAQASVHHATDLDAATKRCAALSAQLESLQRSLDAATLEAQNQRQQHVSEKDHLERMLRNAEQAKSALSSELEQLRNANVTAQKSITKGKGALESHAASERLLAEKEAQIASDASSLAQLKATARESEKMIAFLQGKLKEASNEAELQKREVERLQMNDSVQGKKRQEDAGSRIVALEKRLQQLVEENLRLTDENAAARKEKSQSDKELEALRAQTVALQSQLKQLVAKGKASDDTTVAKAKSDLIAANSEVERLARENESLRVRQAKEAKGFADENAKLKESLAENVTARESLQKETAQLRKQMATTKKSTYVVPACTFEDAAMQTVRRQVADAFSQCVPPKPSAAEEMPSSGNAEGQPSKIAKQTIERLQSKIAQMEKERNDSGASLAERDGRISELTRQVRESDTVNQHAGKTGPFARGGATACCGNRSRRHRRKATHFELPTRCWRARR